VKCKLCNDVGVVRIEDSKGNKRNNMICPMCNGASNSLMAETRRCDSCKWWCLDVCTQETINIDFLSSNGLFMPTEDFFCKYWEQK